ncbi:hypothetical protein Hypma_007980 [Hypsizygus marmoreus]|uniref:MYND-type domain-containing protein n=1 Tax=Hypsizygus marmoreus TaxID=39966 RepID=A0A369JXA1_HYPMA|nr:hypothetical protein Hypma_007980 [Hypsizygus marmoreus]
MSQDDDQAFKQLQRNTQYYLNGGDIHFLAENELFRVHRYFFERESRKFRDQIALPPSPGKPRQGDTESTAIVLEVTAEGFQRLLGVFYNPKYSVYDWDAHDWSSILELAERWEFGEVKNLAIRELEKQTIPVIDRIVLYQKFEVDNAFLVPLYAILCSRPEALDRDESKALGMETTVLIFQTRERLRAQPSDGGRSPLPPGLDSDDVHRTIASLLGTSTSTASFSTGASGSDKQDNTNGSNSENGGEGSKNTFNKNSNGRTGRQHPPARYCSRSCEETITEAKAPSEFAIGWIRLWRLDLFYVLSSISRYLTAFARPLNARPDQYFVTLINKMDSILNVSATSLATLAGLIDDNQDDGRTDAERIQLVRMQLGILQRKPRQEQMPIHHEFAAKYLPVLTEKYKASTGVLNSPETLLNTVSYTPYFVRFARTPEGRVLAALQAKRTAEAASTIGSMTADEVGEIGQFLSTLLVLQGIADIDDSDKAILIPKFKQWERDFSGRLASETSSRCLALLTDDRGMRPMMQGMKMMLEGCLSKCGGPNCQRTQQSSGSDLMQCARCKSAVYCGAEHQRKAWPGHKALCFPAQF